MNKSAIQKFAIQARRDLIEQVKQRAYQYGVNQDGYGDADADTVNGRVLAPVEKSQRQELIRLIQDKGYDQVMEEVAYTWFNRFVALRFMEVNNYLPTHIRVFSDASGAFKPEILSDVLHLELEGLSRERVSEYLEQNDDEGLYRYLLLTQCNALSDCLPRMFEPMGSYTELLLPNNILRPDSVLGHMVSDIPEEDWQDAVQIIGWMYQYYNTELKDDTFAKLKKNIKITKERIPAATQLFTPDWIVRYMVENSLGRIFINSRISCAAGSDQWTEAQRIEQEKELAEQMGWKYYLPEAEQTPEVRAQLRSGQWLVVSGQSLTELKVIDPCMGSGHILVYAFDVLMQIYTASGWDQREAAQSILKNNLFGLDIDDRAAQLAYFAVMMKARQYDRRLFSRGIQPNVMAIRASNGIPDMAISYFHQGNPALAEAIRRIVQELQDAKEYGSILEVQPEDWSALYQRFDEIFDDIDMMRKVALEELLPLVKCAEWMAQKYDVVVTNPPYRGISDCESKLNKYVAQFYPNSKTDLYSVFIERCRSLTIESGFYALITMQSWMYLASYKKLRKVLIDQVTFQNMIVLGSNAFDSGDVGTVVQTAAYIIRKQVTCGFKSMFVDLCEPTSTVGKQALLIDGAKKYIINQSNFSFVDNCQFMYDASSSMLVHFAKDKPFSYYASAKPGMQTSDNDRFLRIWSEVSLGKIGFGLTHDCAMASLYKWFPYNKGVGYRKWYGNNDYIVNFKNDGEELKYWLTHNPKDPSTTSWSRNLRNYQYYYCEGITFTAIGLAFSARLNGPGYLFDTKGPTMFGTNLTYLCGFVNSNTFDAFNQTLCKQMTKSADSVNMVPVLIGSKFRVEKLVRQSRSISKNDWDSYETSWDFKRNPLV